MQRKTSYGVGLMEQGWQDMEFQALRTAFDGGVRVPEPFFLYENILFMELVVDHASRTGCIARVVLHIHCQRPAARHVGR